MIENERSERSNDGENAGQYGAPWTSLFAFQYLASFAHGLSSLTSFVSNTRAYSLLPPRLLTLRLYLHVSA